MNADLPIDDRRMRDVTNGLAKKMAVKGAPVGIGSKAREEFDAIQQDEQTTVPVEAIQRAAKQAEQLRRQYPEYFGND